MEFLGYFKKINTQGEYINIKLKQNNVETYNELQILI